MKNRQSRMTVVFSTVVGLDPGAFVLRHDGSGPIVVNAETAAIDGRTVAKLTFRGNGGKKGAPADGRCTPKIKVEEVHDCLGKALDGDDDGQPGGPVVHVRPAGGRPCP